MSSKGFNRRDHDQEMSMEEILASIRKYVTDEDTSSPTPHPLDAHESPFAHTSAFENDSYARDNMFSGFQAGPESYPSTAQDMSKNIYDAKVTREPTPWSMSEPSVMPPHAEIEPAAAIPTAPSMPQNIQEVAATPAPTPPQNSHDDFIKSISVDARTSTQKSFEKLMATAQSVKEQESPPKKAEVVSDVKNANPLESLVIQAMAPLLSKWMDEHLPKIVEHFVQKEIEQLTQSILKR